MFKLYGDMGVRKLLDKSNEESDIIDTMGEYVSENPDMRFMVIKSDEETDEFYRMVHGCMDYVYYVEEYNQRLKQMNVMKLREEMLDRIEMGKVKTKKIAIKR